MTAGGPAPQRGSRHESEGGGVISLFVSHPNAANLLMVLMVIFGIFSLTRINTQFFQPFGCGKCGINPVAKR